MLDAFLLDQSHPDQPVSPRFNDLVVENFDIKVLEKLPRKVQDVTKALITRKGSNPIYANYGSTLQDAVGARNTPQVDTQIRDGVVETMGYLQQIEDSTDPDERLASISSLSVTKTSNPEEKQINLVVVTESGQSLRSSFPINGG